MNAQEIKNILIAYLKAANHEIRIYQEKSIGGAVCDLMTVTNCLTGYEIKSDLDNYQRLDHQITAYDRFFEKCYIVVGGRHLKSAGQKVPDHWGVITIQSDRVVVNRPARAGNPACASQLSVLWKLELSNLLTKAGLPLYTYKSKEYIIGQIVEKLDQAEIRQHVAYELMHRDYALFNAKDYSLHFKAAQTEDAAGAVSGLPAAEIVDALSEQDFGEMTLDRWIALYAQAKELQKSKEDLSRVRTAPRTPHDIPYTDIEVSLGAPWVSEEIISDFTYFLCTGKEAFAAKGDTPHKLVSYEPLTGYWYVENKQRGYGDRTRIERTYGLPNYNALYILEAALNLREIRRETKEETLAAQEKQEAIEKLFKEWVWQDEDRRWEIEEAYNRIFQDCRAKEYSGRELKFPEMSPDVTLFNYQKDAVMRVISEKNTLLAFDVGAGKTYIMIAAAMKMRQEGRSRKNLFVVPNHIVGQWELIFKQMYPAAKVLSVDPAAFRPQLRQKVLGQIQRGDYDGIIMAYSCFEMIPLSKEYLMEQLERKLRELDASLPGSWKERYFPGTGAAVEREKAYLKKQIFGLIGTLKNRTEAITFDQLEINTLFVDEAHNFKNIPLRSNLKGISGVNITGSKKCLEMLYKVRCVQEQNQGRGAVFATGTPLCNSISDAYAMQMYLQYDKMKETHLDRFDKTSMFLGYSELLNALDTGSTTKITINNKRLNRQNFEQEILIPRQDDYLDGYRAEYNSMLMDKVTDSSNSVVQERYVTLSVHRKNVEEVVNISATSRNHINAMDMEQGYGDGENPVVLKSRAGIKNSRQAVKAADRSARTAQKTAQAAAKAPQRTVKAARATAKAGAAAAKEAAKASVAAIKAAIAAAQELIAALAAGGWAVVAVVLVLCMVGLLIASPFGLFFSNAEGNGSGIPQAVAQINGEFTARIEQIKEETPHDILDLDNDAVAAVLDNWCNVLAVYAVRASADGGSPSGLDGLTAENLALLREVFWDMNQISSFTEAVPKGEDETEIVLHITAVVKTPQEMTVEYGFTDEQKSLLEELLKPEYQELFQTLIGSSQDLTLSVEQVQEILDSLPDDLSEERRQVILTAYQLLGKVNYFWGGKSLVLGWDSRWGTPKEVWAAGSPSTGTVRPYGLDCSGFVDWVFYNISGGSYIIGHGGGAHMQHTYCTPITWAEAIPGDLVFYPEDTHVGIVCGFDSGGNVQIIHCASGANNVVVTGKSGFTTIARPSYYTS